MGVAEKVKSSNLEIFNGHSSEHVLFGEPLAWIEILKRVSGDPGEDQSLEHSNGSS